jgi:hypothetical protein
MSWRIRVVTARHYAGNTLRHDTIDNPAHKTLLWFEYVMNETNFQITKHFNLKTSCWLEARMGEITIRVQKFDVEKKFEHIALI